MFTGLVQSIGTLHRTEPVPEGLRLWIDLSPWAHRPLRGSSIAVSGCCLTVAGDPETTDKGAAYPFVAIPETLSKTILGDLKPGDPVNLEHAATADTLLGGHLVQGHVDGVGIVDRVSTEGEWRVRFTPPHDLVKYLIPKGSITVSGVSLTIAAMDPGEGWFEVTLIPETLEKTTLDALKPGDRVNLEADAMVKTIVHTVTHMQSLGLAPHPG